MTDVVRSPALTAVAGVRHGFFTRRHGFSTGLYASRNCGVGSNDKPESVRANRALAMSDLGLKPEALCTVYQVHGRDAITLTAPPDAALRPKADGMVTRAPGLALGVLAADCAPVLFAHGAARVVGACHAGWRGALAGITDATIEGMEKAGARRDGIVAVVGPCISGKAYEVGPEFPPQFTSQDAGNIRFFTPSPKPGHFYFDLPGYVLARLKLAGVGTVADVQCDTLSDPERFFSYRRATLAGEPDYGRQLSAIALDPRTA
jgi:polyphenol oxidase